MQCFEKFKICYLVELKTKTLLIKVEIDCQRDKGQAIAVLRWVCVYFYIWQYMSYFLAIEK